MTGGPVRIVGPGRMGQGLALALQAGGHAVELIGRRRVPLAGDLELHTGPWAEATRGAATVILAVPDDAIPDATARLAREGAVAGGQVVLHLSGLLDHRVLGPLRGTGAALGSLHPLQTVADPLTAPKRLRGAYAGIEGDAAAVERAAAIARAAGMIPVEIDPGGKAAYHAGAAIVANYAAVLMRIGERLARRAGVADDLAARIYGPLLEGAAANLAAFGPVNALTGPISRGDARTVRAHLAVLEPDERRLYRELGAVALELARAAGLPESSARAVADALAADPDPSETFPSDRP